MLEPKQSEKAVALKYNPQSDMAPIIVASGYGYVAEKIIDIADQSGIPVYRDDTTANMLAMLEIGSNVPPELFEVVAAIYVDLLRLSSDIKKQLAENEKDSAQK